jgi:hypothetical protein
LCAYRGALGDVNNIGMGACGVYDIPWFGVGSLHNNLPPGTQVRSIFTDGSIWRLPPGSIFVNVDWTPVKSIQVC